VRLLWLLAFLLLPTWSHARSAPEISLANVTITATPEGLRADFVLGKPTKRFEFAQADVARDGNFTVTTPTLQYGERAVTSAKAFSRFTLIVRNSEENYDGQYAPLRPIGQGRVLYAYALYGATDQWRTQIRFILPRDHLRTSQQNRAPTGFVYFGPKSYRQDRGSFFLIATPDFPASAQAMVTTSFTEAITNYEAKLAQKLPSKPTVIAQISPNLRGYEGSVSDDYVTHLRLTPLRWEQPIPQMASWIHGFVSHEVFHFWNGGLVSSGGEASWLHEGSAEYAAILTRHENSVEGRQALNSEIASNLLQCESALQRQGNPTLDSLPFLDNSIRYPCGTIMMWAADLRARKLSNGTRSFFDVWRDIIARAMASADRQYKIADFTQLVDQQSGQQVEAIRLLREVSGDQRFANVVAALRADGAVIDQASNPDTRRAAVIIHALRQNCQQVPGKSRGFSMTNNVLTLDTHEACGVLAGSPVVTEIESIGVGAFSAQDFAGFQAKCAAASPLIFTLGDGRTIAVPCTTALPNADLVYSVRG
jgi:hypothetical protein